MQLTITSKNLPTSPAVSEYAEKRLAKVAKRLRDDVPMRLVLRKEGTQAASDRFVAEVTATLKGGTVLRAEERAEDLYVAIDAISDVIARQIRRYRTRQSKRRASLTEWEAAVLEELSPVETAPEPAGETTDQDTPDGTHDRGGSVEPHGAARTQLLRIPERRRPPDQCHLPPT